MKNPITKQERKDTYTGVYLDKDDKRKMSEMAVKKTHESGITHSMSDIVRLAIKEYLKKN